MEREGGEGGEGGERGGVQRYIHNLSVSVCLLHEESVYVAGYNQVPGTV